MNYKIKTALTLLAASTSAHAAVLTGSGGGGEIISVTHTAGDIAASKLDVSGLIADAADLSYVSPTGANAGVTWNSGAQTAAGAGKATFVFVLDANYDLTDFHLWNYRHASSGLGIGTFTIAFDDDLTGAFGPASSAYSTIGISLATPPQTFDVSGLSGASSVRRVELNILTNNGSNQIGLGEVAFTEVPEPSSAALLGLGGLALILRRRK